MAERIPSFSDFYSLYLAEHGHPTCRRLHVVGSALTLVLLGAVLATRAWWGLVALPVLGYGFAWAGHAFFERNRPATFTHPFWSFLADWRLLGEVATGKREF